MGLGRGGGSLISAPCSLIGEVCSAWKEGFLQNHSQLQYSFVSMLISVSYLAALGKIDQVIEAKLNDHV